MWLWKAGPQRGSPQRSGEAGLWRIWGAGGAQLSQLLAPSASPQWASVPSFLNGAPNA